MSFINGLKRFATTTVGLMAIGIGSTALVYTTHRYVIQPHLLQKRREEAEACAEYLFQQEWHSPIANSRPSQDDY
ncbi:uncharacterized protein LOC108050357 [Drosophila rhopaloa]|uniref:Uncharacterized protein LOC108050357 n=1 Tax=Drosophila rhopaloa TaxID=1041015 RepID=A0A6P4FAR5_DRORH|nr:uncharacterized protein LOC108050357 [Drosophila rhopaloa]XP_016987505.1 uncharacterized protein LOC108050357 [Drosophila rhopaloa]